MRIWIGVICAALLILAYIVSHSLLNDVSLPTPEPTETAAAAPKPSIAAPVEPVARMPTPTPAPTPHVAPGPPQAAAQVPPPPQQQYESPLLATAEPVEESPFAGDSREIEYAEMYLHEAGSDRERLNLARQVFERCLEQEPHNKRCSVGLHQTNDRLSKKEGAAFVPLVQSQKQPLMKHHLQRSFKHLVRELEPK